jgi:isochorismate hydrolase
MKEVYFTPESLDGRARGLLAECLQVRPRRAGLKIQIEDSALLVLDMQEYFLQEGSHAYIPSSAAILPQIQALVSAYYRCQRPVIFTRHLNTDDDAHQMKTWWRGLIQESSSLSQITSALNTSSGRVLAKTQYDAFYNTGLESLLIAGGITRVVVCGVMTHLCCDTTARSAFVRGFECLFTVDGTATYNENLHRGALLNLAHGVATPVLVEELLSALGGPGGRG